MAIAHNEGIHWLIFEHIFQVVGVKAAVTQIKGTTNWLRRRNGESKSITAVKHQAVHAVLLHQLIGVSKRIRPTLQWNLELLFSAGKCPLNTLSVKHAT